MHTISIENFEDMLRTLYRGTYAKRSTIREQLQKLGTAGDLLDLPLTDQQIEEYVDRVRLYQEEYRRRQNAGFIGVGLIFDLPVAATEEGRKWLEEDRAAER